MRLFPRALALGLMGVRISSSLSSTVLLVRPLTFAILKLLNPFRTSLSLKPVAEPVGPVADSQLEESMLGAFGLGVLDGRLPVDPVLVCPSTEDAGLLGP